MKKTTKAAPKTETKRVRHSDLQIVFKSDKKAEELPAQAQVILKAVKTAKTTTRSALVASLKAKGLETRQTPLAIWSFYRGRLIDGGFIAVKPVEVKAA